MVESVEALEGDTYEARREDQVHLMVLSNCLAKHLTRKDKDIEKVGSYEEVKQSSERILAYIERCSHTSPPKAVEARPARSYWPSEPGDRVALVTAALGRCEADDAEGHDGWREALNIWTGQ
jgi:ribosomal protein S15P/S13E